MTETTKPSGWGDAELLAKVEAELRDEPKVELSECAKELADLAKAYETAALSMRKIAEKVAASSHEAKANWIASGLMVTFTADKLSGVARRYVGLVIDRTK